MQYIEGRRIRIRVAPRNTRKGNCPFARRWVAARIAHA